MYFFIAMLFPKIATPKTLHNKNLLQNGKKLPTNGKRENFIILSSPQFQMT